MKELAEFAGRLAENPATFLIVVGAIVLVVGAAGGISYNGWLTIPAGLPQNVVMAVGAIMAFAGVVFLFKNPTSRKLYGPEQTGTAKRSNPAPDFGANRHRRTL